MNTFFPATLHRIHVAERSSYTFQNHSHQRINTTAFTFENLRLLAICQATMTLLIIRRRYTTNQVADREDLLSLST